MLFQWLFYFIIPDLEELSILELGKSWNGISIRISDYDFFI